MPDYERWGSPGAQVVTRLLHDSGHAQMVHLGHGEHLHPQQLQDVTVDRKQQVDRWRQRLTGGD